ncbi:MAG TPA: elongation factor Ts [Candidatus Paceibacterota bacterium]
MVISAQLIKDLREKTGAGVSDVKKALEESGGDMARALIIIERKLGSVSEKKIGRETKAGIVDAYIHSNGRIGALVELFCETDFVARNPVFKELAHDIALQVAAMRPLYGSFDVIPPDVWEAEKSRFTIEAQTLNKPSAIIAEIIDGKLKAYFGTVTLLEQSFVKDQNKALKDIINEAIGRFGENIKVGRFVRLEF